MISLPELTLEERAYLQFAQPEKHLLELAERLRQKLTVVLGQKVSVNYLPGVSADESADGVEPLMEIDPGLADAWLTVRYGGRVELKTCQVRDSSLLSNLHGLIRRALAESVFNTGDNAAWPQDMRFQACIGMQQGTVRIFWNSMHAMSWARRVIREKT